MKKYYFYLWIFLSFQALANADMKDSCENFKTTMTHQDQMFSYDTNIVFQEKKLIKPNKQIKELNIIFNNELIGIPWIQNESIQLTKPDVKSLKHKNYFEVTIYLVDSTIHEHFENEYMNEFTWLKKESIFKSAHNLWFAYQGFKYRLDDLNCNSTYEDVVKKIAMLYIKSSYVRAGSLAFIYKKYDIGFVTYNPELRIADLYVLKSDTLLHLSFIKIKDLQYFEEWLYGILLNE